MLETVWFLLWGALWAVYFMLDGFDFGVGMLFPFFGKTDNEKSRILASIAPFWDGNEVWLVAAGGVTFAAFPAVYAVLFSALYSPLMIILFALIIRAVSLEFRDKVENGTWRTIFSAGVFLGSFLPAFLFGVVFANIFMGIPIDAEGVFHGTIMTFLNPYGLAGGLFFLFLFLMHGTLWLARHPDTSFSARAALLSKRIWLALALATLLFLIQTGASTQIWDNYRTYPLLLVVPFLVIGAVLSIRRCTQTGLFRKAFYASSALIGSSVLFGVLGLFPKLLPSTLNSAYDLTIRNSASTPLSLGIMLGAVLLLIPIVFVYQAWAYKVLRASPETAARQPADTTTPEQSPGAGTDTLDS